MSSIKNMIKESRSKEVDNTLSEKVSELEKEGLIVEFGKIGTRTTYALIHDESYEREIVGYTFLKDLTYYRENIGKLKALQQALIRKEIADKQETSKN